MLKLGTLVLLTTYLSAASLVACTVKQAGAPGAGATGAPAASDAGGLGLGLKQDSGTGATASAGGLTCQAIVQCITECPEADMACPDACGEKGSPDGQAKVLALAQCIEKEKCTEETCLQTKCQASLEACVKSSAPTASGKPIEGTAPSGNVPADMVGSFAIANFGTTTRVSLRADGTGTYQIANASVTTGCTSSTSVSETGNAVVTADTITIYATDVETRRKVCSSPSVTEKGDPDTVVIKYVREDENTLKIVDQGCAAKYMNEYSAQTYCTERLKRE